ncbi:hypothetical protein BDW02DRAFT_466612, partial [Decorospora gaudefroyi]
VPKLALLVTSSAFRSYVQTCPDTISIRITHGSLDYQSLSTLLNWVNQIMSLPGHKLGVNVPVDCIQIIKTRYAAQVLGMEPYVRHFVENYKLGLRYRTPTPYEFQVVEECSLVEKDDMVEAVGRRIAYLCR